MLEVSALSSGYMSGLVVLVGGPRDGEIHPDDERDGDGGRHFESLTGGQAYYMPDYPTRFKQTGKGWARILHLAAERPVGENQIRPR
jgi:hypothetical protein